MSVILKLPMPISANDYWRSFVPPGRTRAIVTLSREAKKYKLQVGWLAKAQGVKEPILGRVHVHIDIYPKRPLDWQTRMRKLGARWDDTVHATDIDNLRKVLYDSLKNVVIADDKWIWSDSATRREPDGEARVLVTVTPIVIETPQEALAL